jgi:hypothetical protein
MSVWEKTMLELFTKRKSELIILLGGLILMILVIPLGALCDDWAYVTAPHLDFQFSVRSIDRLFDNLYGLLLTQCPALFPWLNHIIIVLIHTICTLLFYKLAQNPFGVSKNYALIFALLFLLGSTSYASVCYTDTFNNALSLVFGLLGILTYHGTASRAKKIGMYLLFCLLSLLSKESGVTFFAVIPLFDIVDCKDKSEIVTFIKNALTAYLFGIVMFAVYYISPVSNIERGVFSLSHMLKNLALGSGASYSAIDLNALLYNKNYIIFGLTALLSLPAIAYLFVSVAISIKRFNPFTAKLLLLILCSILALLPFTVSHYRSINEIHIYAEVFFALLIYAVVFNSLKNTKRKLAVIILTAFILAHSISVVEKYISSFISSKDQYDFINRYAEQMDKSRSAPKIYTFNLNSDGDASYSTFSANPQIASTFGYALNSLYNWKADISFFQLYNDTDIKEHLPFESEHEYIDMPDDQFLLYVQERAKVEQSSGECDIAVVLMPTGQFYVYGDT